MLNDGSGNFDVLILHDGSRNRDLLYFGRHERLHLQILDPEINRRLVGTQKIVGHLLEWRRTERTHPVGHALHPANEEERAIFGVVVGVMMRDEDRANAAEWNAGAGE